MANMAILRVEKIKTMSGLAARGKHNFRERETPNADAERTPLNRVAGAKSTDDLMQRVSELLPVKRRKDAVIALEYLITASPEHFSGWEKKGADWGLGYFQDAIAWLEKRHGKENVICKTVHLDESTPHLAAFVVPKTKDGRLAAKDFVGGVKVLSQMQTDFAAQVGLKHGLARGQERSKATHKDNAHIKAMTVERVALKRQVKSLEVEVARLTKRVGAGDSALITAQAVLAEAKAAIARLERLVNETAKRNTVLTKENTAMKQTLATATERDRELVAEITALRAENENAQPSIEQLKAIDRVLIDEARQRLQREADRADDAAWNGFHANAKALRMREPLSPTQTPTHDPQKPSTAFLDAWKPSSASGVCHGTIVAMEGPWAVQHVGKGAHVLHQVDPGAVQVGDKVTISAGQVTVNAPAERGGRSRG